HMLQYWLQGWGLIEDVISDEDRLAWMKVMIHAIRDRYKAGRNEFAVNLTFHPLLPVLQAAVAFPAMKESPAWLAFMADRLEKDFAALPFCSEDGYTREANG